MRWLFLLFPLACMCEEIDLSQFKMKGSHLMYFTDEYVIKLSRGTTQDNREICREGHVIRYLNSMGCRSCPQLLEMGFGYGGRVYLKIEYIPSSIVPPREKMVAAYLEQKHYGVFQGDPYVSNFRYRDGRCILIDYGLAKIDPDYLTMSNEEFLELVFDKIVE